MFENLLLGLIFLVSGLILLLFPPKKINGIYGYRTPTSMENERNWVIANKYSSKLFIFFGLLLMVIGVVSKSFVVTIIFAVIFNILLFVIVEQKLGK